jgi:hypothetical protein
MFWTASGCLPPRFLKLGNRFAEGGPRIYDEGTFSRTTPGTERNIPKASTVDLPGKFIGKWLIRVFDESFYDIRKTLLPEGWCFLLTREFICL